MDLTKSRPKLDDFLKTLNQYISSLPATKPKHILELYSKNNKSIPPFPQDVCPSMSGDWDIFHYSAPSSIKLIGSYILQLQVKPKSNIDLAIELPLECYTRRDYLDYRWALKNALYLSHLATQITKWDSILSVHFFYLNNNTLKPAIVLRAKNHPKIDIRLLPHPPNELFKLTKLLPYENCVRHNLDSLSSPNPTPLYNNSLLSTLFYEQHLHSIFTAMELCPAIRDAVLLVKEWLRRRNLEDGWGGFSGFLGTMLLTYLLSCRNVSNGMSEFQIFRVFILTLASSNWTEEPISLFPEGQEPPIDPGSFTPFYPVTFVDTSGYVNLAGDLSLAQYSRVRHEAQISLSQLDSSRAFDLLFHTCVPFLDSFDCVIRIEELHSILSHIKDTVTTGEVPEIGSQLLPTVIYRMLKILEKGLGDKVRIISHTALYYDPWGIDTHPPVVPHPDQLSLGFIYTGSEMFSGQIIGPPLSDPVSVVFSELWGDKVEMRRFPDGAVCPVVVWPCSNPSESRIIPFLITRHLLATHMGVCPDKVTFPGMQLDQLLHISDQSSIGPEIPLSTGETSSSRVQDLFGELTQKLFALKHLPLRISSVQGTHAVFRGCHVFPPSLAPSGRALLALKSEGDDPSFLLPNADLSTPRYTPALTAVLNLAISGKWPDELEAIWRVKTAFYLELYHQLKKQLILSLPTRFFLDVFFHGFVFRFQVSYFREVQYLQNYPGPLDLTVQLNARASELLFETKTLPTYTARVHGLILKYSSLSAAIRLTKRWIHSQMFSTLIPDVIIEMLVLYVYLNSELFTSPGHHVTAFLRFLSLLSLHSWETEPIIINPSNQISEEDIKEIRIQFPKLRHTLPPLFLVSPWDKESKITASTPSLPVLNRLTILARQTYKYLSSFLIPQIGSTPLVDIKALFRPPLNDFDVIIRIRLKFAPRALYAVDPLVVPPVQESKQRKVMNMPVVEFDPVEKFVKELRSRFEKIALFFVDEWGGREVGVVWQPSYQLTDRFRVNQCGGKRYKQDSQLMDVNLHSVLNDFRMIGGDMIEDIISNSK
ncbi:Nucleolar protein 6 [Oopsacas minuta]|uniref:Nucleolar protein 6 n=1 Tax=Oopsacas minuta TaxID=111878 RepID=A0AAV7KIU9_9METZ|nr:Nucleolar protein 6 [Oopsacas minuta]